MWKRQERLQFRQKSWLRLFESCHHRQLNLVLQESNE